MIKIVLIIVVVLIFLALCYSWLDSRISLDHSERALESRAKEIELYQHLLLEIGVNKKKQEILQIAQKLEDAGHIVKSERADELEIDGVVLQFQGDSLVNVRSL